MKKMFECCKCTTVGIKLALGSVPNPAPPPIHLSPLSPIVGLYMFIQVQKYLNKF